MKSYTYKFADGTTSTVKVDDELFDILVEFDRQEKYGNRRETRRHISLEKLVEQCVDPPIWDEYFNDEIFGNITDEKLQCALDELSNKQRDLLAMVVLDEKSFRTIAKEKGVSKEAIRQQFLVISKKIKDFLA